MANTGRKITVTLKEVYQDDLSPTGNTKPNDIDDPDYIAPSEDLTACPVTYSTACPNLAYATNLESGSVIFEYAVPSSALLNPTITSIKTVLAGTIDEGATTVVKSTLAGNYVTGILIPTTTGSHTIRVEYLNSSNSVIATCPAIKTLNITILPPESNE